MALRKIIRIDEEKCTGCGDCIPNCVEGALQIVDGKARLVKDIYCDGLGACLGDCPFGALSVEEREADEFDEEAALAHALMQKETPPAPKIPLLPCGCSSSAVRDMSKKSGVAQSGKKVEGANKEAKESLLGNWPVQIRLVPEDAPYLKGADLLISADCVSVAYRAFQSKFAAGRVVLIGCPKFDDKDLYIEKFTSMFRKNAPKSIMVARMEVPCCGGLPALVKVAIAESGIDIIYSEATIGIEGEILKEDIDVDIS